MIRQPKILLILLVLLPLLLLGWGGWRLVAYEQRQVEENFRNLLTERLGDIDRQIAGSIDELAADMQLLTAIDNYDPEELREIVRNEPRLFQIFVIDPNDLLTYPSPTGPWTSIEREFLLKASDLINDRMLQAAEEGLSPDSLNSAKASSNSGKYIQQPNQSLAESAGHWHVWYWGPGMNLIYWQRRPNGHIVGVALERARWIADLIAELPDTPIVTESETSAPSRVQIVESGSEIIYKWGQYDFDKSSTPTARMQMSAPLSAWELESYVPLERLAAGRTGQLSLLIGLGVSGLALMGLAFVIDREYGREMQEAQRRVSFVNQVSHELRTPLTNIRMYAELLENDLDFESEADERTQKRVAVILTESQRLSRLISNVLAFARHEKSTLRVTPQQVVPDETIRNVLQSFQPSLEQHEIEVKLELNATRAMSLDRDFLEQILCNLISNVEKYAANGHLLKIQSEQIHDLLRVTISDHGPGIDRKTSEKIFEPFWRASNDLHQAAGTGIGLTIVRYLAELHQGGAWLEASTTGAVFVVELRELREEGLS